VVIITSNNEKELPDAFLRRCVFHYIEFPNRELMAKIVKVHHPDLTDKVLDQCLEVFYGLRATPKLRKRPTTSELIDWICALQKAGVDLGKIGGGIPFLGTLLKTEQDVELMGKRARAVAMLVDFLFELRKDGLKVSSHEWLALMEAMDLGPARQLARRLLPAGAHGVRQGRRRLRRLRSRVRPLLRRRHRGRAGPDQGPRGVAGRSAPAGAADRRADRAAQAARPRRAARAVRAAAQGAEGAPRRRQPVDRHRRHVAVRHPTARTRPGCGSAAAAGARRWRWPASAATRSTGATSCSTSARSTSRCAGCASSGRDGADEELDLDETVDETCRNAGDLELVFRPPRRNRVKVILLMDVGGSMDPHAELASRLFTAASRAGRFAKFRSYYFHNCVYEHVYEDAHFTKRVAVADLISHSDKDEKLVMLGDALMHPAELLDPGGSYSYVAGSRSPGRRVAAPPEHPLPPHRLAQPRARSLLGRLDDRGHRRAVPDVPAHPRRPRRGRPLSRPRRPAPDNRQPDPMGQSGGGVEAGGPAAGLARGLPGPLHVLTYRARSSNGRTGCGARPRRCRVPSTSSRTDVRSGVAPPRRLAGEPPRAVQLDRRQRWFERGEE
jgi:hypothetical protein